MAGCLHRRWTWQAKDVVRCVVCHTPFPYDGRCRDCKETIDQHAKDERGRLQACRVKAKGK